MKANYLVGQTFYCKDTRCKVIITEVHSDGHYMAEPLVEHYIFEEMEYKYPAMKYRFATVDRMVSVNYWEVI